MTIHRRFFGGLALSVFMGCATGGTLAIDNLAPRDAVAQDVDESYFYANLAPHGQWFFQADFGWVWHPARVSAGWRPYTEGQWLWADDVGWTWASQEPWGWATYHYGRWYFDPYYGWSWVPGRTWAPAWVSWRIEAGYIGWAPLWPVYFDHHPEYRWDRWSHDHDWDRRHDGRDWDRWVFTRDRDFTSDRVGRHAITDRRQRDEIFSRSRDVTKLDESRPERIGHSIDRAMVEKATGRPVRSVKIEAADKPDAAVDTKSERIRMFRPAVRQAAEKTPDRLGLAKEPSREARETDTLRQEKLRLDSIPEADKKRADARKPVMREKDVERGGGAPAEPAAAAPGERDRAHPAKKQDRTPDAKAGNMPKADRDAPADAAKGDRSQKAEPADRAKPERAPSGQRRPDGAAAEPQAQRKRAQPQRTERDAAPPPERSRPDKAQPQRERVQTKPDASSQEAAPQQHPAQKERAQGENKKQPRPDAPNESGSDGGDPDKRKK